jgi:hypothetical protein
MWQCIVPQKKTGHNTHIKHVNTTLKQAAEYKLLRQYTIKDAPHPSKKEKRNYENEVSQQIFNSNSELRPLSTTHKPYQILLSTQSTPKVMIYIDLFMLGSKSLQWFI